MEQNSFLAKLYEFKQFKVVESPENSKKSRTLSSGSPGSFKSTLQRLNTLPDPLTERATFTQDPLFQKVSSNKQANIKEWSCNDIGYCLEKQNMQIDETKLVGTPNKQNKFEMGIMIESHLYTNLSSSIDTLFSKIEKIKQEFEGSAHKKNSKDKKSTNKLAESPIMKFCESIEESKNSISSLNTLIPLISNINQAVLNQQGKVEANSIINGSFERPILGSFNEMPLIQSFQLNSIVMPATHTYQNNYKKPPTIIDEINGLLDNSYKNYPSHQQNERSNTFLQYRIQPATVQNQQEHDQLDGQFLTIKLKTTQSQKAPALLHKNSFRQKKAKNTCNLNDLDVIFRIDQPIHQEEREEHDLKLHISNKQLTMRQFELGRCVGSGKFGDVHICKHKKTGFVFALKKIFKSTILEYGMIEQFSQELKIHYLLSNNHPNITKLYAHFHDEYHIFLLMEYIEDGTLMNHLQSHEIFVSDVVTQVLDAVEHLHRNRVIHRDIKPQNLLLSNGVVKMCDFGWSSQLNDGMRKTFCGTLDYVSPQMKDVGEYSTSVDLWSIGVLTFELLAGFAPYKKQIDRWKVNGGKIQNKWRWDVIFPPQISQHARQFIESLLTQNPDNRASIRECKEQQFLVKYSKVRQNNVVFELGQILE